MAGQTWSITIVPGSPNASFIPDVYTEDSSTPTALQAQNGDIVTWNNQTGDEHQPWQTDSTFTIGSTPDAQLCDTIEPYKSSTPGYCPSGTAGTTIYYACRIHPAEQGTIEVVA